MCLDVVGKYISWIDIGLIANDKFVPVILRFMSMPLLRESACDCIHEIISKGMDPIAKIKLVESFTDVLENVGVLNLSEVCFNFITSNDTNSCYMDRLFILSFPFVRMAVWQLFLIYTLASKYNCSKFK